MGNKIIFTNDDDVEISLPSHEYSDWFMSRNEHEVIFRKINTILIKNKFINNIVDLGCWIGDNSIPWAKNIDGFVYAIDPSKDNCDYIKNLMEINEINNIILINEAISDTSRIISTNDNLFHSTYNLDDSGFYKKNSVSLDILYEKKLIRNIDYIHLDVEGMESLVVKGSEKIISDFQPIISFEQHISTDDYIGLSNHLKQKKYIVLLINEVLPGCREDCRNFLAFPERISLDSIKNNIIDVLNIPEIFTII